MESRAKLFGHAVHPILIVFPLGLLATGVIFDVIHMITATATFAIVAYWMIAAGLIGGFLAAPFGWYDWFNIPSNTRARTIGLIHGFSNTAALLFFVISWAMRINDPERPDTMASVLSIIGFMFALFGGWLGGELVERLGVGVYDDANLNATNSLTHTPHAPKANVK